MKRFIAHHELARDSRFVRQDNVAPIIEVSVKGTEATPLYEEYGSDWVREFTKNDPARAEAAQAFRRQVDKQFSFGGSRSDRADAAIPIAREDRIEAGFTEEELRERHQARRAAAGVEKQA